MDIIQPQHLTVIRDGTRLHVARMGSSEWPSPSGRGSKARRTLVFLHGWPEFWWTYAPLMERLSAMGYDCVAPDLRGFGDSDKAPEGRTDQAGAEVHTADVLTILDELRLDRVGIVSHDVGAYVAQSLGRQAPERLAGLFFFDCPYPGIGPRAATPDRLREIWYTSFHTLPWAADLVGSSRDACRIYFGGLIRHWAAGNPAAFDDATLDVFVDNFLKPGNLQGGFNWYVSYAEKRLKMMRGEVEHLTPIAVPTCVRWGELDPVLLATWADRLGETFTDLDSEPFAGAGHFPHRERADEAAAMIDAFFRSRLPG